MVTRTDSIQETITAELERHRKAIDADETTTLLTISVRLNDGGWPTLVEMERRSRKELTRRIRA